jgi:predicted transcriptional regulator
MRTVKDIITGKPQADNVIKPDALVIDALHLLSEVNLSYLVVMDGRDYKGIISERDYSRNVALKGRSSRDTMVKDAMATDLPAVALHDTVEHCMNLMTQQKARYLVAFNHDGHFEGVITIHDLLRQVIASREGVFDHALTQQLINADESGGRIY